MKVRFIVYVYTSASFKLIRKSIRNDHKSGRSILRRQNQKIEEMVFTNWQIKASMNRKVVGICKATILPSMYEMLEMIKV